MSVHGFTRENPPKSYRNKYILPAISPVPKTEANCERILERALKCANGLYSYHLQEQITWTIKDSPPLINEQTPTGDTQRAKMPRRYEQMAYSSIAPTCSQS